jgi:ADP-heptose:LPS heptosyltransferase
MRVLAVRLSAMGDVVHSLGAVRALAEARPDVELHMVVQRPFAPLLLGFPGLCSVVEHDRRPALRGLLRTAKSLRALAFDVALDLQGNWKSAAVAWLSRARVRVGLQPAARREPGSARLLTRTVAAGADLHPAAAALAVVRALAPQAQARPVRLRAGAEEVEAEACAVREAGVDPRLPFAVLVAGSTSDNRTWPAAAMLRHARRARTPSLALLGPAQGDEARPAGLPVLRHGPGEVRRLLALGAVVAAAGGEVLGPDQGPTHVLAAAGAATAFLYGPQDPARTAPAGARVLVRSDGPPCVPCRARRCAHPAGPVCMDFAPGDA